MIVRRLLWLLALCAAAAAGVAAWQRRAAASPAPIAPPVWPPLETPPAAAEPPPAAAPAVTAAAWIAPVDGACPDGYPVKAKQSSGIYHVPGGRFYERTVPDRCYVDPAAAEADGYRASKS